MMLRTLMPFLFLGVLVSGQDACFPINPCRDNGVCSITPDGGSYCACQDLWEGDMCQKASVGSCSDTNRNVYGKKEGILLSQGHPGPYPPQQNCPYFLGTADAKKFEFTFNSLALEDRKDELSIGNTSVANFLMDIVTLSETEYPVLPEPLVVEGNRAWINLYTDSNIENSGFNISFRIDGDECIGEPCLPNEKCIDLDFAYMCEQVVTLSKSCLPNPCANGGVCKSRPGGTPYCICAVNFHGDTCQQEIVSSCNEPTRYFFGAKQGVITSPGFPGPYPDAQDCIYFLGKPDAKKVEITVHSLDFEGQDSLTIGNGTLADYRENQYLFGNSFNGSVPPPAPFEILGDRVWLNLFTDGFQPRTGFNITYRIDGNECLDNVCSQPTEMCVDEEYSFSCKLIEQSVPTGSTTTMINSATSRPIGEPTFPSPPMVSSSAAIQTTLVQTTAAPIPPTVTVRIGTDTIASASEEDESDDDDDDDDDEDEENYTNKLKGTGNETNKKKRRRMRKQRRGDDR